MTTSSDPRADDGEENADNAPISNGPNARPRDETISSTGGGLPNDTSTPVEISPEEERKIADAIRSI